MASESVIFRVDTGQMLKSNSLSIPRHPPLNKQIVLKLQWAKHPDHWYELASLNFESSYFDNLSGVYIIWHGGANPAVVRVGQGVIGDRLSNHNQDPEILAYKGLGLFATWAAVPAIHLDGVERHLGDKWNPKVGDRFPNVYPVEVNSPWQS